MVVLQRRVMTMAMVEAVTANRLYNLRPAVIICFCKLVKFKDTWRAVYGGPDAGGRVPAWSAMITAVNLGPPPRQVLWYYPAHATLAGEGERTHPMSPRVKPYETQQQKLQCDLNLDEPAELVKTVPPTERLTSSDRTPVSPWRRRM